MVSQIPYGKIDANIRFNINGGYLRKCLQCKNRRYNKEWDKAETQAWARHMKSLPAAHQMAHQKFVDFPALTF
jgi:hypothetical protein